MLNKHSMKPFLFLIILSLAAFTTLPSQSSSSGQALGQNVSDAFAQMESALSQINDDISPQDAYFLGRARAANILTRYRLYTPKPAVRYLNQICFAITVNSPMPDIYNGYHAAILDSPDLNAFATMGGHVFVCRGLLEALTTEDALAAVLAHEIAHIQLGHSIELIKKTRLTQDISNIAEQAAGLGTQKIRFDTTVRELDALLANGYSREQEFAADSYAIKLLVNAGYSPSSLVDVLTLLQKAGGTGGYNSTHPQPALRISNVRGEVSRYPVQDTREARKERFAKEKERLSE
jgi:predicted Zn-dependent protease